MTGDETRDAIVAFICSHVAENGYPPSVREIGEHVGLSSTSTVHMHLKRLQADGRLTFVPGKVRTLRVVA